MFLSFRWFVIVGQTVSAEVGDPTSEDVANTVGERVRVDTSAVFDASVNAPVGVLVGVIKSVANACTVSTRSAL